MDVANRFDRSVPRTDMDPLVVYGPGTLLAATNGYGIYLVNEDSTLSFFGPLYPMTEPVEGDFSATIGSPVALDASRGALVLEGSASGPATYNGYFKPLDTIPVGEVYEALLCFTPMPQVTNGANVSVAVANQLGEYVITIGQIYETIATTPSTARVALEVCELVKSGGSWSRTRLFAHYLGAFQTYWINIQIDDTGTLFLEGGLDPYFTKLIDVPSNPQVTGDLQVGFGMWYPGSDMTASIALLNFADGIVGAEPVVPVEPSFVEPETGTPVEPAEEPVDPFVEPPILDPNDDPPV